MIKRPQKIVELSSDREKFYSFTQMMLETVDHLLELLRPLIKQQKKLSVAAQFIK
jgi:hypothetical protein